VPQTERSPHTCLSYSIGTFAPLVVALLILLPLTAPAATIRVPADQPSIQQAIDAATNGDLVLVSPGTYLENIDYHGKGITIQSAGGPEQTILDGNHHGTVVTFNTQEGAQSVLSGFTIRYGSASYGGGVRLTFGTSPTITNNIFSENIQLVGGNGAAISGNGSSPVIDRNTFLANVCDEQFSAGVVCFANNSSPLIINNIFKDNPCRAINLSITAGGIPVIANNTIVRNSVGVRVNGMWGTSNQLFANNILTGNGIGLFLEFPDPGSPPRWSNNLVFNNSTNYSGLADQTGLNGNISADPLFVPTSSYFQLQSHSPAIDAGTLSVPGLPPLDFLGQPRVVDGDGNGSVLPDLGACEFTLVSPTPTPTSTPTPTPTATPAVVIHVPTDQPTIQQAINAVGNGALILVLPGTYFEHLDYNGKAISIQSTDGPEQTRLDGSNTGTVATFRSLEGSQSVLSGFTIQNGNASFGAGIRLQGASPTITGNIFRDNAQQGGGFGAAIGGNGSSAWIERNTFVANTCDNQFTSGVVSFVNGSSPHIINNIFINNPCRAINMSLPAGSAPVIAHNTIMQNRVGVRVDARVVTFAHLYANNIVTGNGVGLQVDFLSAGHEPRWHNNLVFKNSTNYSGIADQTQLNGNISSDPMFVPIKDDFRLQRRSPAIDAGTLSIPGLPPTDFAGRPRVVDGNLDGLALPDLGAYEFIPLRLEVTGPLGLLAPPTK
jgi:hypothetical protein